MNTPINSPSRSTFHSPVRTPVESDATYPAQRLKPGETTAVSQALQTAFTGMQFDNLFEGLHSLFQIRQVVITGSETKAIHAQLNPDRYSTPFRSPNDIDVIVNAHRLISAPLHDASQLNTFGLRTPDASKSHVLEYSSGGKTVKIDLIPSDMKMVKGEFNVVERHGSVAISSLQSLQRLDRSRLSSGEGNPTQIKSDLLFFKSPADPIVGKRKPESPDSSLRKVRRRLI